MIQLNLPGFSESYYNICHKLSCKVLSFRSSSDGHVPPHLLHHQVVGITHHRCVEVLRGKGDSYAFICPPSANAEQKNIENVALSQHS